MENSRSRRRAFLKQLGAGVTVAGTGLTVGATTGAAQDAGPMFHPARHAQDAWMDSLPGTHRLVIDATTPRGFAEALAFAGNFLTASAEGYNLTDHDNAVVIVARHFATPFAFKDAVWAKYGQAMPPVATLNDPKTGQRPAFNLLNAEGYGMDVPNFGTTVDAIVGRGVHIAVCQMATKFFAGLFAKAVGGTPDNAYSELAGSVFNNSHLVSAGIVAVGRAQEHGYTLAAAG
jgi:hypothetical protein